MKRHKGAFSFIELIITLAIIVLLSVVGLNVNQSYKIKANNSRIQADVKTMQNALINYSSDNTLPLPGGNRNYIDTDGNYIHDWSQSGSFAVYGKLTNNLLPKAYINSTPKDHNTNQYFAYGVTKPDFEGSVGNQFEIAAIIGQDGDYKSIVHGNYTGEAKLYNLIKEYNGPDLVYNGSQSNFPYNPEQRQLTASLKHITGSNISVNGDVSATNQELVTGDTITLGAGTQADLYLADGSVSKLSENTTLTLSEMTYKTEDNLLSRVSIFLANGTIWTKATDLNDDGSEFQISTTDSTASVRGTIFGITKTSTETSITVQKGTIEVIHPNRPTAPIDILTPTTSMNQSGQSPTGVKISGVYTLGTFNRLDMITNPQTITTPQPSDIRGSNFTLQGLLQCPPGQEEFNGECVENALQNGREIFAYAPYDSPEDLNMYLKDGNIISAVATHILNDEGALPSICAGPNTNQNISFCDTGNEKGIFIDNLGGSIKKDDIQYTLDYIDNNTYEYALEIRGNVSGTHTKYLFKIWDIKGIINNNNTYILKKGNTPQFSTGITSNQFITSMNKQIGGNLYSDISQGGQVLNSHTFTYSPLMQNGYILYVGNNGSNNQIHGILDYVKIYRK